MEKKYQDTDYFDENEIIRAYFSVAQRDGDMHSHPFWELSYAYEGNGTCCIDKADFSAQDCAFFLLKPGSKHCFLSQAKEAGAPLRLCSCIFTQDFLDSILAKYKATPGIRNYTLYENITDTKSFAISLQDDNALNIRHLLWLIAHEYNHYTTGSETIISNSMVSLLICITRLYEYQTNQAIQMVSKSSDIDELLKYIRTNYGSRLSLDLLAAHMHLSREYLCRYFKKHTGKTISDFILEVRISQAKQMLEETSHPVADIGVYCGYPSVSSFQRSFKKVTSMSPSEFRITKRAKTH